MMVLRDGAFRRYLGLDEVIKAGPLWTELCSHCPHSYVDVLTLKVLVLGGGAFGRRLGLDEVTKAGPP